MLNAIAFTNFEKISNEAHVLRWQPVVGILFPLEHLPVALSLFYALNQFDLDNMALNLRGS